ncbi:MAG: sodium/proline symporter PutP [Gammaproteobacteria bacterium]|nr:sodium/proline symporter PutP [Gammaproteobacteria bacterium]
MIDVFTAHRGPILLAFGLYLLICLVLGFVAWARTRSLGDYILGGRSLNPWVTALSAQATDMSGWLLMGLPGLAYAAGIASGWMALGLAIGTYLNWRYVAAPLREATQKLDDALTLPDYFERRFPARTPTLRLLTAAFILIFFTFYSASGFVAAGKLFQVLFALPYREAVLAGSLAMLAYTFFGGFLAVSWSDVLQGSLMFVALVIVALVGIAHAGGPAGMMATLAGRHADLLDPFSVAAGAAGTVGVVSLLAWGLGYPGQPHILARFMAIRSASEMRAARRIAMIWVVSVLVAAIVVGLAGAVNLTTPLVGGDREKVFMFLAVRDFPAFIAGVCLAAILAAIMSTASAQLLVAGSAAAQDFYRGLLRPGAGRRELLWTGRLAVLAIAALAIVLALSSHQNVLNLVAWAWAGFGAAFGPAIVASLYWPRTTRAGVLAAIVAGGATVIVWHYLDDRWLHWGLYAMVPGVLLGTAAILIGSRKTA